ncbi:MAG: monovalent cation/H(+) antiporter subunit G [Clostridia bacterium]|nr:monovalent cation/H(+) antiporter subunit G [Clostridia bacterium]
MLEWIRFIISAALILSGLVVMCLGVIGVFRFKYVLNRMHAAAMNDTMGIGLVMLGLIVMSGFTFTSLKLLLVILLLWMSSPVSSHLIGRLEITTNEDISREMEVKL